MLGHWLILAADEPQQQRGPFGLEMLPALVMIVLAFYFIMIRPMKRQEKEKQNLLGATKKNDKIVTSGGIIGTVVSFADDEVVVRVDDNVRLRMLKGSIVRNLTQEETMKAASAQSLSVSPSKGEESAKESKA